VKRILLSGLIIIGLGAFLLVAGGASNSGSVAGTYKIELDNAFGLVSGADFKVAGVPAGKIESIELPNRCVKGDPRQCYALVTVQVTQSGFGQFHSDAFCQSRPQSLIGEYFIECQPGSKGKVLKPGSTIPVTNTESTIPADLLQNVMRMPYRERFSLIINELGAAVAGRSDDLAAALRRAVPALDETDNLLNLLANDSHTLQQLTVSSNQVITALANNSTNVQRFITEANNTATDTATQDANLQGTFQRLPGFLEQLKPAMQKLGATADANEPVLRNLNDASAQLDRFFTDLPSFSKSSLPAIKSLGKASVTGKQAVQAAGPTIKNLNTFAKPAPELAQNLAIVLHDLDDRGRAVEKDSRSPGGQGYTGLEALLQYAFNQALAINQFSEFGHMLTVDAFIDPRCAPFTTANTGSNSITNDLVKYGANYRQCYAWLGPNQPGVNETDPTDPTACVPDPGGAPPDEPGPKTTAKKCTASASADSSNAARAKGKSSSAKHSSSEPVSSTGNSPPGSTSAGSGPDGLNLKSTINKILGLVGSAGSAPSSAASTAAGAVNGAAGATSSAASGAAGSAGKQTQQLLNYLLAP
jgi:virulence factor Mce-like protein